jgi:acetate kinase
MQVARFFAIHSSPLLPATVGLAADGAARTRRIECDLAREAMASRSTAQLEPPIERERPVEATVQALLYIRHPEGIVEERGSAARKDVGAGDHILGQRNATAMTTATEPLIGVLNAGSSSLKFSFYEGEKRLLSGQVDGIGIHPRVSASGPDGRPIAPPELGSKPATVPSELLPALIPWARRQLGDRPLAALGHRVVHGGMRHSRPARVTAELLGELEALVPLAPLHEPHNLAPIKMALQLNPELPQVACFDTAFHRTAPEIEQAFALPYSLYEEGVRRYGFHGLSYEYIASVLPQRAPDIAGSRVVVAHLGNGCSACALKGGVSAATTMGFTALDGLPMGTRCGELDVGVVLHLIQQKDMTPDGLVELLYRRSGMLGVSGVSSDFRELLASKEPRARFAIELFCYRVARHIASLAAAMDGLDGIVFTAGVGENAAPVRAAICRGCAWLGLDLDEAANSEHRERISTEASRVTAYVIKTDENLMIARHARAVVQS